MSDDLRTRVATALCENDGLDRSSIGYGALWGGYLEAADAVLSVRDDDYEKLCSALASSKAAHGAVWELHQQRGTRIFELQGECGRLRDDRNHWEIEAGNQAQEVEKLRDLLRVEHERANAAIEREETSDEAAAEIGQYARRLERERDDYKRAYEAKPATMRLEGPGAERLIEAMQRPVHHTEILFCDRPTPDVEDLKATIVSQAREIARLKGESV